GSQARRVRRQARLRGDPRAAGQALPPLREAARTAVRRAGAPRHAPALGPAPGARRRPGLVRRAQRAADRAQAQPPGGPHGGPPAGVPGLPRADPRGLVRGGVHDDLGPRDLRGPQVGGPQDRGPPPWRAGRRPLRALPAERRRILAGGGRQELDDPPHGGGARSGRRAHARPRSAAHARPHGGPAARRRRALGVRDQVGRDPRRPPLRARHPAALHPQPQRGDGRLSRAAAVQPGAEPPPGDPRRRDRGPGRRRDPELLPAPAAHARHVGVRRAAPGARRPGDARPLRRPLARRPSRHGPLVRRAPRPPARARRRRRALDRPRPRRRPRLPGPGRRAGAGARGRGGQAPRLPLRAGAARERLAEGEGHPAPGGRGRRLASRRGAPARPDRRAPGRRLRGGRAALRRPRRHGLHPGRARPPRQDARPARDGRGAGGDPQGGPARAARRGLGDATLARGGGVHGVDAGRRPAPPVLQGPARRQAGGGGGPRDPEGPGAARGGPRGAPEQPGQGALSRGRVHEDRRARVLPGDRARAAAAHGGPAPDAQALSQRRGRQVLLREERPVAPPGLGPDRGDPGHPLRALRGPRDAGVAEQPRRPRAPHADGSRGGHRPPDHDRLRPRPGAGRDDRRVLPRGGLAARDVPGAAPGERGQDERVQGPAGVRAAQPPRRLLRPQQGLLEGGGRAPGGRGARARRLPPAQGPARGQDPRRLEPERPAQDDGLRLLPARPRAPDRLHARDLGRGGRLRARRRPRPAALHLRPGRDPRRRARGPLRGRAVRRPGAAGAV
ncbi:MAG: DNA_ligase_IV_Ku-like, partial [uncultured Solirubrobacteraceae bacterium]